MSLARKAISIMEEGQTEEAIQLLREAEELDPANPVFPYEIGYAHYLAEAYGQAAKVLKKTSKRKDPGAQVFSLLGNAYDNLGNQKKAIKAYEAGIKAYPGSAIFYVELGILEGRRNKFNDAIRYWEQGVRVDPNYASNYFHLANIFAQTEEHIWTVLYGETFINLEPGSGRTQAMSKTLYQAYQKAIDLRGDSAKVDFVRQMTMTISDLTSLKLPAPMMFGKAMTMGTLAVTGQTETDATNLLKIRTAFLDNWYDEGHAETYPNVLIDRLRALQGAGHLEAYNYWIFSQGDPVAYEFFTSDNATAFRAFAEWFGDHPLDIPQDRALTRASFR